MILVEKVRSRAAKWLDRVHPSGRTRSAGCWSAARRRLTWLRMALAALCLAVSVPVSAASTEGYQVVGDLAVYLGIVPAQIVRGHLAQHPEARMHGGAPVGSGEYHIVVAIFDAATGARVTDARVGATVSGLGHIGETRIALEPMLTEGVVTYGGFVSLAGHDRYTLVIEIRRPGDAAERRADFAYEVEAE